MGRINAYTPGEVIDAIAANRGLLLVHFGSPLASSCEFVHKELEAVAPVFGEHMQLAEVEVPLQDVEVLRRYAIDEIPTLILFRGSAEVERLVRILLPEEFREFIDACLAFYGGDGSPGALE